MSNDFVPVIIFIIIILDSPRSNPNFLFKLSYSSKNNNNQIQSEPNQKSTG